MRAPSDYVAAAYAAECEAMASVGRWQDAGWTVVGVDYRPDYAERPWLLWLRANEAEAETEGDAALEQPVSETRPLVAVG